MRDGGFVLLAALLALLFELFVLLAELPLAISSEACASPGG